MIVIKFGGTSVGSTERFKSLVNLVVNDTPKIVVLSAMSGTTNALVEIGKYLYNKNKESALLEILALENKYKKTIEELFTTEKQLLQILHYIKQIKPDNFNFQGYEIDRSTYN